MEEEFGRSTDMNPVTVAIKIKRCPLITYFPETAKYSELYKIL
jgi:hypothetical protein